jgi:hypothetical protein
MSGSQSYSVLQMEQDMMSELDDNRRAGPSSLPDKDTRGVSRSNKAMAAISGAAVTSLISALAYKDSFSDRLLTNDASYSFAVTPFDVIKTRLQTQGSHEPLFQPSSSSAPGTSCCQTTFVAEKSGMLCQYDPRVETKAGTTARSNLNRASQVKQADSGLTSSNRARIIRLQPHISSGISAIACEYPDREVAARELESVRNSGRVAGLWDGVMKVGRTEGVKGLWRGLTPTL